MDIMYVMYLYLFTRIEQLVIKYVMYSVMYTFTNITWYACISYV